MSLFPAKVAKGDREGTRKALDKWFTAEQKDHAVFAERCQMNGNL